MHARTSAKVAAVIAASALALTGCAAGNSVQPAADLSAKVDYTGTVSILTKFAGEPLSPYFEDLAKAYEAQHPDVKVELIQETDQSIKDKTKTLTASGALPDIIFSWTGNWAENFIRGGIAADLTDVVGPDSEWGASFGAASLDTFKYDGKYYGIPLYNNGKFMGYNTAIFNELGLSVPTSFEELIDSCSVIRDAGYEPIAFGNKDGWPGLHYLQQLFAYNVPTDVLHADFAPATAKLDDEGYIASLEQFKTLVDECTDTGSGTNGVLYSTAQQALASGNAAMYYQEILEFDTVTAEGNVVTPDTFGIFKLPVPAEAAGDPDAIEGAPEGYLINSKSKNPQLALDFMKFVTTRENATTLASPPYGQPSTVVGAVTEDSASKAVMDGITQVNDASQIVIWLDTVTVPEVADAWLAGGEALISGSSTPEEVLESV
ncbi:MAG: carbohydrate transporter substrate-binding protein, partial [Cryobacterium sp.]|nr:carbohydrate transporter substrate-binding protein [Cryobacterium sp.]